MYRNNSLKSLDFLIDGSERSPSSSSNAAFNKKITGFDKVIEENLELILKRISFLKLNLIYFSAVRQLKNLIQTK